MKELTSTQVMPIDLGVIHLIGIGGIGISGIAEILFNLGYQVQGSDMSEGPNVVRLREKGIKVFVGHKAENIENVAVIVKSTAVKDTNPEIQEAKKRGVPVLKRSDMLAEILRLRKTVAIAGSHGKTTTTSLAAHLFEAGKKAPTVINGGIINSKATNAYLGSGEWLVAEADESDGTFTEIPATIGVITNIDPEHLEHYNGSFENLKSAFRQFIAQLPFYGFAVACKDHKVVADMVERIEDRKIITYGINSDDVDIKVTDIIMKGDFSTFSLIVSENVGPEKRERKIENITLPMPGMHNISNATAALAVAIELGFEEDVIINGLKSFEGVKRRFTITGEVNDVLIVDDYAHHPAEVKAVLDTAKNVAAERGGKVIAILQPHRYTRLRDCFTEFSECMSDADHIIITSVFEAGELPIEGYDSASLVEAVKKNINHNNVSLLQSLDDLVETLQPIIEPHDLVIGMGAGTISKYMNDLPVELMSATKRTTQTA